MTPTNVDLVYQARNPHELSCHIIADATGEYERHGVRVRLVTQDGASTGSATVACAGSVLGAATGRSQQKVAFVACIRPMFFIYAADPITQIEQLRGKAFATFPAPSPPAALLRAALRRSGIDPHSDVEMISLPTAERLAALRSGEVAGALVGSDLAPGADRLKEFRMLADLGDKIHFPSTGLAFPMDADDDHVEALVASHRAALRTLHTDPQRAANTIATTLGLDPGHQGALARDLPTRFTQSGTIDTTEIQHGVYLVLREVDGASPLSIQQLIRP